MPIPVVCHSCTAKFAVNDSLMGKKIRCVKCRSVLEVNSSHSVSPSQLPGKDGRSETGRTATRTKAAVTDDAPRKARVVRPETLDSPARPAAPEVATPRVVKARRVESPPAEAATRGSARPPVRARRVEIDSTRPAPANDSRTRRGRETKEKGQLVKAAIPANAFDPPPRDFEKFHRQVLTSFQADTIDHVPVEWSYRIGIVLVSIFMIALPIVYMAMIGGVGWAVWYHFTNHTGIMKSAGSSGSGRAVVFAGLIYLAPAAMGIVLILFMLKPLFSKPGNNSGRRSLQPGDEPLLFEFVDRICSIVGAPPPQRIDIDCNINASAGFNRGILSMFGNDLVLTIGMPLVAGLDMRQFSGVLAHEFGHFAQGTGMRVSYIIRSISYWFTRVVYERDAWDEKLEEWSKEMDLRIGWIFHLTRLAVWLSRRVLWLLMVTGHAVSGFLLRQMEYDADRHEARLAGSDIFASTARQLSVLGIAHHGALADLGQFYDEGRLGDNLPKLIVLNVEQIPEKLLKKIQEHETTAKTGLFDTHPADRDRIASAARENTDGIFAVSSPASHLFRRFDFHARAVTWDFYKEVFGKELRKSSIHPVDDLIERQKLQQ
ncbi:MAG: M48 family metalloprotease, partial [Planctomycetaceae bacterium]|nr:M48 family metalloprotease [Planctomycetaceae bacterium]